MHNALWQYGTEKCSTHLSGMLILPNSCRWQESLQPVASSPNEMYKQTLFKSHYIPPHAASIDTAIAYLLHCSKLRNKVQQWNSTWTSALGGNQMCAGMAMYAKKKGDTRIWGINVQKHRKQKTSNVKCLSWHSPATALEWSHTITSNWILCITAQRPEHYSQG